MVIDEGNKRTFLQGSSDSKERSNIAMDKGKRLGRFMGLRGKRDPRLFCTKTNITR